MSEPEKIKVIERNGVSVSLSDKLLIPGFQSEAFDSVFEESKVLRRDLQGLKYGIPDSPRMTDLNIQRIPENKAHFLFDNSEQRFGGGLLDRMETLFRKNDRMLKFIQKLKKHHEAD